VPELRERWPRLPDQTVDDTPRQRLRLFDALVRCLLALAARRPLLLVLDDLHWADDATLAWLEHLGPRLGAARLLVVGAYRAEEETPALAQARLALRHAAALRELRLERLSSDAVARLVQQMAGVGERAAGFGRRLYAETEGNPLFLVEALRALVEAGVVRVGGRGWQADWEQAAAARLPLPATVREVIGARLARLGASARQVLEAAAVVGRDFDDRLAAQASGRGEEEAALALEEALRAQLVAERDGGYRFTHDKIQEVAYAGLSAARRRLLHRRVAEALERRHPARPELSGELALHFERAEDWERALLHARTAAARAKQVYAPSEALAFYALALAAHARLLEHAPAPRQPALPAQRFELLSERHGVWTLVGQFEHARLDLEEMVALARRLDDDRRLSDALNGLGYHHMNLGRAADARAPLEEALAAKRRLGDALGQADSLNVLTTVYLALGDRERGLAASAEARRLYQALGDPNGVARGEWSLGAALYELVGHYEQAIAHLERALELSRASGNQALECGSLLMLGAAHARLGDAPVARARLEPALARARAIGDRPAQGWALLYASWLDREAAAFEPALEGARQALALAEESHNDFLRWYALHSLARVCLARGRPREALPFAQQARQVSLEARLQLGAGPRALATLARVELALGHPDAAHGVALEALRALRAQGDVGVAEVQDLYLNCALALRARDPARARAVLERAHAAMTAQAEAIADPARRARFLDGLAVHRELRAAWDAAAPPVR